jgi:hypothetical protein
LQELGKSGAEVNVNLGKQGKVVDMMSKDVLKKRSKLGDADIVDNFRTRMEGMQEVE